MSSPVQITCDIPVDPFRMLGFKLPDKDSLPEPPLIETLRRDLGELDGVKQVRVPDRRYVVVTTETLDVRGPVIKVVNQTLHGLIGSDRPLPVLRRVGNLQAFPHIRHAAYPLVPTTAARHG